MICEKGLESGVIVPMRLCVVKHFRQYKSANAITLQRKHCYIGFGICHIKKYRYKSGKCWEFPGIFTKRRKMNKNRNAKGEGSFKENPNGTITHRKSVGYKADGNRKILTVTADTKAACIKEMRRKEEWWNQCRNKEKIGIGTTVVELCERHLHYQVERAELREKSIDRRECTINNQIGKYELGRMQAYNVKVADVDNHITELMGEGKLSASSIEKVVDVLNAAFNWSVTRGELEHNPVEPIKPTLDKRIQKMKQKTANEADVDVLSKEDQAIFERTAMEVCEKNGKMKFAGGLYSLLLLYTGMRCGEMLALRWKDVDFANGMLTIEKSRSMAKNRNRKSEADAKYIMVEGTTKNEKAREIELSKKALKILSLMRSADSEGKDEDLIIRTKTGKPNTTTNIEHCVATIFRNAELTELKGGVHIFRRTYATRMYENGARVKEIAAYIGDLESTTERYYIAVRQKVKDGGRTKQVVRIPTEKAF